MMAMGGLSIGRFIQPIIGRTFWVRPVRSQRGFSYEALHGNRYVIMPDWIEHFDTDELIGVELNARISVIGDQVLIAD